MPRPLKFPGLQPKFEAALQAVLAKEPLSGADIQGKLQTEKTTFSFEDAELRELGKNFANYVTRAKEAGVIQSGGPWAGYQLVRLQPALTVSQPESSMSADRQARRPSEAAIHFVATCGLSIHFGGRVSSLPTSVDTITWGNADMLMVRANPSRRRLEDISLDPEILRLADASPECILTSIELKYGLERDRRAWFQAVAEAAANSRWANESMLVHVSSEQHSAPIDEEVISLARASEIGVLELSIASSSATRRSIEVRVISPAPQRTFLRLVELSGNRAGLLREAHALLESWNDDVVTFLDEEGAPGKLLRLLRQALANLRRQSSFLPAQTLDTALMPLEKETRIRNLYGAALDTAATATDAASTFTAAELLLGKVMNELPKKDYDAFLPDLAGLKKFAMSTDLAADGRPT